MLVWVMLYMLAIPVLGQAAAQNGFRSGKTFDPLMRAAQNGFHSGKTFDPLIRAAQNGFPWTVAKAPNFRVYVASAQDRRYLPQVFAVLRKARAQLLEKGFALGEVSLFVHPNLASYTARYKPYMLAVAQRSQSQIHTQRLWVVVERAGLERTLRHELFHLAQPADWPRWKAEGSAMRFAGELPKARPLKVDEPTLNRLLANPPDALTLNRAMATAYAWVKAGR
jgi:hypothetical protein